MLGKNRSKATPSAGSKKCVREEKPLFESSESFSEAREKSEYLQITPDDPVGEKTWPVAQKEEASAEPKQPEIRKLGPEQSISKLSEGDTSAPRLAAPEKVWTLRTHDLSFATEDKSREFASILRGVQAYLSKGHSNLVTEDTIDEMKVQIRHFVGKYIQGHRITVERVTTDQLIDGIYFEMAGFGFLTKHIYGEGIEEIDMNAQDDVEVQYSEGITEKLMERFDSPEHVINVVRWMLHVSDMVLDDASLDVLGHLSKNIRIAVLKSPIMDKDVGVATPIRIVNPQSMKKEDFIRGGIATEQILDFLSERIHYDISVCVAGVTSSGKTTLLGWLFTAIPGSKRIYSIENGSRELAPVHKDEKGCMKNSVIHTLTRNSENERQRVDQIVLLDMAPQFNPGVIVMGEMRRPEANAVQEAAHTGVTVVTTIHSMSCDTIYWRMVPLCRRAVDISNDMLTGFVTEAYPIVAFCEQLENEERRLMGIIKYKILADSSWRFRLLFQYQISENRIEDSGLIITSEHCWVDPISKSLACRLMENRMPKEMLTKLRTIGKGGGSP